jgi:hypothetical protein
MAIRTTLLTPTLLAGLFQKGDSFPETRLDTPTIKYSEIG